LMLKRDLVTHSSPSGRWRQPAKAPEFPKIPVSSSLRSSSNRRFPADLLVLSKKTAVESSRRGSCRWTRYTYLFFFPAFQRDWGVKWIWPQSEEFGSKVTKRYCWLLENPAVESPAWKMIWTEKAVLSNRRDFYGMKVWYLSSEADSTLSKEFFVRF
jgi:hypothetical protein